MTVPKGTRGKPGAKETPRPPRRAAKAAPPGERPAPVRAVQPEVLAPEQLGEPGEDELPEQEEAQEITGKLAGPESPALTPQEDRKRPRAATSTAVGFTDALQLYLSEIRKTPLLSREEEHAVAVRYREQGDLDAAFRLVTANLRLVVKIAMDYQSVYTNLLDLIQEGNIGLMQAVKQYNPYRDVKLSSYAAWWIRAFILRYIINNWRLVKIGTTRAQRKLFFNLKKERERLEAMGYDASPRLLAERLDVSVKDVEEMSARMGSPDLALDEPLGAEGQTTFLDALADTREGPEGIVGREESRARTMEVIRELAETLPEKERAILDRRLLAEEPETLQAIGDSFGITKERTRQLEARLIRRLREALVARMGDILPAGGQDQ
jgi:RNA polymerase sigma-32 factor